MTYLAKVAALVGAAVYLVVWAMLMRSGSSQLRLPATVALPFILGMSYSYARIKSVVLVGDHLEISAYSRRISVRLRDVERISGNPIIKNWPVRIHLIKPTALGSTVSFMPRRRLFGWGTHPVVERLTDLVVIAKEVVH